MAKAYVIADIDVTDTVAYEDYKRLSTQAAELYGARFLVRGGALEFEDEGAARRWYDSPEYAEARAVRQRAAESSLVLVSGV
jgi:uncharacterized protein (DUF1330 family)